MATWIIPDTVENIIFPTTVLQEFADSLEKDTNGKLKGQVTETILTDSFDKPKLYYAMHIYITKLKQSYRFIDIEQISPEPYPINLTVIGYSEPIVYRNIDSEMSLRKTMTTISKHASVGILLAHFIRLSELKEII